MGFNDFHLFFHSFSTSASLEMQGVSFTSLWLVCGIFTASAVPTDNADISPNSVLTSYGLNVSQTLPIGNVGFTCQILQTLFPRNDTFSANSTYYTNLYEVPWYNLLALYHLLRIHADYSLGHIPAG